MIVWDERIAFLVPSSLLTNTIRDKGKQINKCEQHPLGIAVIPLDSTNLFFAFAKTIDNELD